MRALRSRLTFCAAAFVIAAAVGPLRLSVTAQEPTPARFAADTMLWRRMLAAEDTRGRGAEGLAPLRAGLRAADAELRAWAVRALGRLEADSLLPEILASLDDVEVDVRAQAANAAAQAVVNGDPQRARAALLERAKRETDPWVLGVVAESLGRLAAGDSAEVDRTAEALLGLSRAPGTDADAATEVPPVQLVGVVKGLYFLARQAEAGGVLPASVVLRLVELTAYGLGGPLDVAAPDLAEAPGDTAAETGARTDTASGASADTVPGIGVAETVGAGQDTVKRAARRVRTVATAALVATGAASEEQLAAVLEDPAPYVRREAGAGAAVLEDRSAARNLAERALDDPSGVVRYEGLRVLGRIADDADACERMREATQDRSAQVALLAIDLLGTPRCAIRPGIAQLLDREARTLPPARPSADTAAAPGSQARGGWHRAAHAIVALAAADPARARRRLPAFVEHEDLFVRMYAARAASALGDDRTLRQLAADAHPNVRAEAIGALRAHVGHDADSLYIAQLAEDDSQLLQAAAAALAGSSSTAAPAALLDALDRGTAARRETSRDARRALLERIAELGAPSQADRLDSYLRDFDPVIAEQAADVIEAWTGARPDVEPSVPPATPLPALDELRTLAGARVIIEMAESAEESPDAPTPAEAPDPAEAAERGADRAPGNDDRPAPPATSARENTIELRLLPFVAPTNVDRFVRLARQGYYDGLTFHRVAPNFVIQGGSPRANEYAGDGPFTRDELGLAGNWRGTVGLSTRGRDTGDAQLYVNLVDNTRLDHDYTVWAEIVEGMDVVDRTLEGAVIRKITVQ